MIRAVGIDLSTIQLDIVSLTSSSEVDTYHCIVLPKPTADERRTQTVGLILDTKLQFIGVALRALMATLEPDIVYLERPRGPYSTAKLGQVYGACFASIGTSRIAVSGVEPQEWRRILDLPPSLPKEQGIAAAGELLGFEGTEHACEAALIALAAWTESMENQ